jgi:MFS family permease
MKNESRWRVLVYVYVSMITFAVIFQVIPPVLGFIISSMELSHTQAGALMSFFALPGILIAIPGGILADVYGPKRIGIAALIIALAGSLLVGLGGSFPVLLSGRFLSGVGALTISRWFTRGDLGRAMGIFNTAMPVGTILALNSFGRLAALSNWRLPVLLTAAYSLVILVLFFYKHPGLPGEEGQKIREKVDFKKRISSLRETGGAVWLVSLVWMMYNAAAISYLTFTGDYYSTAGYDVSYAGFLTSLFMIGSLLFCPLVGYWVDKVGRQEFFIAGGSIALALLLLLVPRSGLNPLLLGSLIGIAAAFIPAPVFSLVPRFLPPGRVGMGYGILSTCLNIGVLVGPLLVGFSYDQAQNYLMGFNLMAIFAVLTALIALWLRFMNRAELSRRES